MTLLTRSGTLDPRMRAFVAVTDNEWYRHLAVLPEVDEVNFWQPVGARRFLALTPGELFLFKLHAPLSFIVGGGFFVRNTLLPVSMAWEWFREKNGARSLLEMRERIERYRGVSDPRDDYEIGCILLTQPFFLPWHEWFPPPQDFDRNIQVGKRYDLQQPPYGSWLRRQVQARLDIEELKRWVRFGTPVPEGQQLGPGSFRLLVTETYERRCAVTQERALPALEVAQIRPVAAGGAHRIDNGLLLRSDLQGLFAHGYLTVTRDYRIRVSSRLRRDFETGQSYLEFDGRELRLPSYPEDRPNREFLEWHADVVFRG